MTDMNSYRINAVAKNCFTILVCTVYHQMVTYDRDAAHTITISYGSLRQLFIQNKDRVSFETAYSCFKEVRMSVSCREVRGKWLKRWITKWSKFLLLTEWKGTNVLPDTENIERFPLLLNQSSIEKFSITYLITELYQLNGFLSFHWTLYNDYCKSILSRKLYTFLSRFSTKCHSVQLKETMKERNSVVLDITLVLVFSSN
jgi:hypothetical protein